MTGNPAKLASALMKISGNMKKMPTKDLRQAEGLNAFFIIPALFWKLDFQPVFDTSSTGKEDTEAHADGNVHELGKTAEKIC